MIDTLKNISSVGAMCSGCGACINSCSKNCIKMTLNSEGFLYPEIDTEECINCTKCVRVCPAVIEAYKHLPQKAFAATSRQSAETEKSSSGGIFYELARFIICEKQGYVCGAVLEDDLTLHNIVTNKMVDVAKMQGSKYIQSRAEKCPSKIKELIESEVPVLFCGTPCQVAGIKNFCGNSEFLYTVDLVCHGTPSAVAFSDYMKRVYKRSVFPMLSFRKKNKYTKSEYALSYKNMNRPIPYFKDPFYQSFMDGINYRESCYSCPYAQRKRVGDMTVGDCATWSSYSLPNDKVTSIVTVNTEKGEYLWDSIKERLHFEDADYGKESAKNKQLNAPVTRNSKRDEFYNDFAVMTIKELKRKYCHKRGLKTRLVYFVISHTTPRQRNALKRLVKKI